MCRLAPKYTPSLVFLVQTNWESLRLPHDNDPVEREGNSLRLVETQKAQHHRIGSVRIFSEFQHIEPTAEENHRFLARGTFRTVERAPWHRAYSWHPMVLVIGSSPKTGGFLPTLQKTGANATNDVRSNFGFVVSSNSVSLQTHGISSMLYWRVPLS